MTRGKAVGRVLPIILAGTALLVTLDIVGAFAEKPLGFPYPPWSAISFLVYMAIGAIGAWRGNIATGLVAATAVGLLDGWLGPLAAWMVGPGPVAQSITEPGVFAYGIAVVTASAAAAGLIGALAASWVEWRRTIRGVVPR